jgi:hypothetical protein
MIVYSVLLASRRAEGFGWPLSDAGSSARWRLFDALIAWTIAATLYAVILRLTYRGPRGPRGPQTSPHIWPQWRQAEFEALDGNTGSR